MQPYEHIVNHKLITDWFGYWPSFHDAEILSMHLDRRPSGKEPGPSLRVRLHAFEPTSEVDERGYHRLRKHAIITLEFAGMDEITLDGFNNQNVIAELDIDEAVSPEGQPGLNIAFRSSFGVGCDFRCELARVKSVEPGRPSDGIYA